MSDVSVSLSSTRVAAGGWLRGSVTTAAPTSSPLVVAVLWSTSGQGSPDERVIHRRELTTSQGGMSFEAKVPLTPTSYDGHCLKIAWRVRVSAGAAVTEVPFEVVPSL